MKRIIVRACAIIAAWIAFSANVALALPIVSGSRVSADMYENLMGTPGNGYVQTTGYTVLDESETDASGSDSMFFEPVTGLFAGSAGKGMAGCYVDPATMCVAVKWIQAYPPAAGGTGLFSDERLCLSEDCRTPMPVPGTMFVIGVGLLGLSTFKKRNPHIVPLAQRDVRSKDRDFFPAHIPVAEARAAEGSASVIPISAAAHQRTASRGAERYRGVMKYRPSNLKKEMAG